MNLADSQTYFFFSPKNGMFFGSALSRALENQPESELTFKRRATRCRPLPTVTCSPPTWRLPDLLVLLLLSQLVSSVSPASVCSHQSWHFTATAFFKLKTNGVFVLLLNAFFIMLKIISRLELKMCYFYAALFHSALIETDLRSCCWAQLLIQSRQRCLCFPHCHMFWGVAASPNTRSTWLLAFFASWHAFRSGITGWGKLSRGGC